MMGYKTNRVPLFLITFRRSKVIQQPAGTKEENLKSRRKKTSAAPSQSQAPETGWNKDDDDDE
jgi:hypothetical protein